MNKLVLGALTTAVVGAASLASETEWPELDRELEALSSTYQDQTSGGPEIDGWIIGAWDYSSDLTTTDDTTGEVKDLSGVRMRSARLRAMGDVNNYGYKLEFDFFDSEQNLFVQNVLGLSSTDGSGIFDSGEGDPTGHVLDAYGEVNVADSFNIRLGRFRPPVLQSALIDRNRTVFIDRSILGSIFATRDEGAMVNGDFERVGWYLAVQNGTDGVADDYLFTGRLTVDILGEGAGLTNEGAYNSGEETNLMLGASFSDDGALQDGTIIAGEAYLSSGPFALSGEIGDFDNSFGTLANSTPWAATGTYMITENYEIALRWEEVDDAANSQVWSGGINWYHDDWNTKWQLQYSTSNSDQVALEADVVSLGLVVSF